MVEVYGVDVKKEQFDQWMGELHAEWELLDEWDKEYYEDEEDFIGMELHSKVYSED